MAITNLDDLAVAMINGYRQSFQRGSVSSVAGCDSLLWRSIGFPSMGNIPTAAAVCAATTVGAYPLATRSAGQDRVLARVAALASNAGTTILFEDRLMHMGGLSGIVTTAQTANLNLYSNLANSNLDARKGAADYSEVEWWLDWYVTTGSTAVTPSVSVTYADGTTGSASIWLLGAINTPASMAAARRAKISPTNGKFIRSVESVTLSGTTGVAGNFGVSCTRVLSTACVPIANSLRMFDWMQLGCPKIEDNACLTFSANAAGGSTGTLNGYVTQAVL